MFDVECDFRFWFLSVVVEEFDYFIYGSCGDWQVVVYCFDQVYWQFFVVGGQNVFVELFQQFLSVFLLVVESYVVGEGEFLSYVFEILV